MKNLACKAILPGIFVATILTACTSPPATPTSSPATTTTNRTIEIPLPVEENSPPPIRVATPSAVPISMPAAYELPKWVADPDADVIMFVSAVDETDGSFTLTIANVASQETVDIQLTIDLVSSYSWHRDGKSFWLLSTDRESIYTVELATGLIRQQTISEHVIRYANIEPLGNQFYVEYDDIEEGFLILSRFIYANSSYDDLYFADRLFQIEGKPIVIENLVTGETVELVNSTEDGLYSVRYKWSPTDLLIAILRGTEEPHFTYLVGNLLSIYDIFGNIYASFKFDSNIRFYGWSPDGNSILYTNDFNAEYPCILNISNGEMVCLPLIEANHPNSLIGGFRWALGGTHIAYSYSSWDTEEGGACLYGIYRFSIECPTMGLEILEGLFPDGPMAFSISSDKKYITIYHPSCLSCDYNTNPTIYIYNVDSDTLFTVGKQVYSSYFQMFYPAPLWRPVIDP